MLVTLTTDFGTSDSYVAQMKGVILGLAPSAVLVDITHDISPQDVRQGAVVIDGAMDAFPDGTVHLGVVDPGVGTARRGVAVLTSRGIFIGPDNGLFSAALERVQVLASVSLENPAFHRCPVSSTFHGRDIFAPAAGHLAAGTALHALGPPAGRLVRLSLPRPRQVDGGIEAHVLLIDRFGNLILDLRQGEIAGDPARQTVAAGDCRIPRISATYADVAPGEPVAYFGSSGRLEVAIRDGNAAQRLGVRPDQAVLVRATSS